MHGAYLMSPLVSTTLLQLHFVKKLVQEFIQDMLAEDFVMIGFLSLLFLSGGLLSDQGESSDIEDIVWHHANCVRDFLVFHESNPALHEYEEDFTICIILSNRDYIYESDLRGACAIGSYILWKELCRRGLDAHFVFGGYFGGAPRHCWVTVGDMIVDITASQFGKPWIYMTSIDNQNYQETALDFVALRRLREQWCPSQVPYFDILRKYRKEIS
jgi:hypothetical protein